MDSGEERAGVLCVSCSDTSPALEMQESVFNEMAQLVKLFIIFTLLCAVFLWRDNRLYSLFLSLIKDGISVVTFVSKKILCR